MREQKLNFTAETADVDCAGFLHMSDLDLPSHHLVRSLINSTDKAEC